MKDDNEERLRSAFGRLREEHEAGAPNFQALISGGRSSTPPAAAWRRRSILVLAAAAAIGVIAIGLMHRKDREPYRIGLATTHWRGPTDFLLAVSVDPVLSTVPRLGATDLPWRTP
ncbi:MAG: hypothetical protein ACREMO_01090 [Gemmatimonadales bacterium]